VASQLVELSHLVAARLGALGQVVSQLVGKREEHAKTRFPIVRVYRISAQILHGPSTCRITVQSHAENVVLEASHQVASRVEALRLVVSQLVEAHAKTRFQTVQACLWASARTHHGLSTCQTIVPGFAENAGDQWL